MGKERKYRAWDGNTMHYNVVPWRWDFVIDLSMHKCLQSTGDGFLGSGGKTARFEVPAIAFKELMEYTGLKDRHGAEVWEGDVLEFDKYEWYRSVIRSKEWLDAQPPHRFPVVWGEGQWQVSGCFSDIPVYCERIGNIYQHPHLLEHP